MNQKINQPNNSFNTAADVVKYQGRLRNFIRKRVDSVEDVKDILQEVFFQFAKADYLSQSIEQVEAWLYTVARHKIIDWSRKTKSVPLSMLQNSDSDFLFGDELNSILFEEVSTPENEYLRSIVWQELEAALLELPPEQKEVFVLSELEGIPFKKIAAQTGITVNTLISRKRYAVLFLRERLKELYLEILEY